MKKKDINSVAYLFNEMDPSEEVEFNRELEENENLLIEVESLKAVQAKLGELPDISAPQHVLDAVYREAEKSGVKSPGFFKSYYYAAAAMVIVGLTAGSFMMDNSSDNSADSVDQAVTGFSQFSPSLDAAGNPGSSNSERTAKITPWVDNNEVYDLARTSAWSLHPWIQ
ncbi:MAG: hypothetical protein JJU46_03655 [Balneolaceae bacterium]|nr:hypothetical protein [Balneolaceae bacterium]